MRRWCASSRRGYMCVTMCSWTEDITADLVELFYQA